MFGVISSEDNTYLYAAKWRSGELTITDETMYFVEGFKDV